ncbi:MAG TPA: hypothetical protein VHL34_18220 [Rhizomicrobium sp.]|jgi:hypothetical protein|nr:hypothetical protein [Rhizomicrobium sp.]
MSSAGITGFDSSLLLNYFGSRLTSSAASVATSPTTSGGFTNNIVSSKTPWDSSNVKSTETQDAEALSNTKFLDLSDPAIRGAATTDAAKSDQDTQKLFALYKALDRLSYLASMGSRDTTSDGQLPGLNARFQSGLTEVQNFMSTATFNNFTLLSGDKSSSIASTAAVPPTASNYVGGMVVKGKALFQPVPNVSATDDFKITVTKGGVATDVNIDLSQVSGPLTLDNITSYVNSQLSAAGFSTKFQRVVVDDGADALTAAQDKATKDGNKATIDPLTYESFGLQIKTVGAEKISLSAASSSPAIYLAGSTGTTAANDQQGRLTKLVDLSTSARGEFAENITPDDGTATAASTVVDKQGNVYVLGTTTGSFGGQLQKGTSDVYLTKYDSAGNKLWTRLAGSEASAQGYSLTLDPTGGVVIAGTTTGTLSQTATGGNGDAFVAKYTTDGTQSWLHQVSPLSKDGAFAVSVDSAGNVYVGGQVTGTLAAGQTNNGSSDATITKLDKNGKTVYRQQFGTSGADQVSQVATTSDGGLVVASVQNGHAIVSKYANGDATGAPVWTQDLGDLKGGSLGGIAVDNDKVYVSGATTNASLNAGGQATTVNASSGGSDAFVFRIDDAGTTATANYVSYVGTSNTDKGAGVAVSDGKVYLTGTTKGVFAGQTQSFANTENMFVTQLDQDGSVEWSKQFGGVEGTSQGAGIAVDPNGSSVLDALGLPRGNISLSQSVYLADQTTVREGDSFKLQVSALGVSNATIRISKNETMSSLATKINTYLGTKGKASVTYNKNGAALRISVNAGVEVKLSSGPTGSDALAGLGIDPGIIVKDPSTKNGVPTNTTWAKQLPVYGLSMPKTALDISTKDGAKAARSQLLAVEGALRTAYRKINTPVTTAYTNTQSGQAAPAYLTSQLGTYNLALAMLGGGTSGGTTA